MFVLITLTEIFNEDHGKSHGHYLCNCFLLLHQSGVINGNDESQI